MTYPIHWFCSQMAIIESIRDSMDPVVKEVLRVTWERFSTDVDNRIKAKFPENYTEARDVAKSFVTATSWLDVDKAFSTLRYVPTDRSTINTYRRILFYLMRDFIQEIIDTTDHVDYAMSQIDNFDNKRRCVEFANALLKAYDNLGTREVNDIIADVKSFIEM